MINKNDINKWHESGESAHRKVRNEIDSARKKAGKGIAAHKALISKKGMYKGNLSNKASRDSENYKGNANQ